MTGGEGWSTQMLTCKSNAAGVETLKEKKKTKKKHKRFKKKQTFITLCRLAGSLSWRQPSSWWARSPASWTRGRPRRSWRLPVRLKSWSGRCISARRPSSPTWRTSAAPNRRLVTLSHTITKLAVSGALASLHATGISQTGSGTRPAACLTFPSTRRP